MLYRGFSFLGLKQYEKAITDFERVLEKDLEGSEEEKKLVNLYKKDAWGKKGTAFYCLQQYEEAIVSFKEALSRESDTGGALLFYDIGCCYTLQGETDKAIASLEQAIALDINFLETAKTDTDFDSIRELPEFQRIMKTIADER